MSQQGVTFPSKGPATQPRVTAQIQINGQWKSYNGIMDSGNDLNLITLQTAQQLGITPQMAKHNFKVQFGESKTQGHNFYMIQTPMRFGGLKPFMAKVGVGPVRENLIGRSDVFQNHDIVFPAGGGVKMYQSSPDKNTFGINFQPGYMNQFQNQHKASQYRGLGIAPANFI